jgi:wolfamin
MSSGILSKPAEVTVKAQHVFGNFTQGLNISDRIWFIGILRNFMPSTFDEGETRMSVNYDSNNMRLGRKNPLIELQSVGCIHCHNTELNAIHMNDGPRINPRMKDLLRGVKYLLNVLLNPLVNFK